MPLNMLLLPSRYPRLKNPRSPFHNDVIIVKFDLYLFGCAFLKQAKCEFSMPWHRSACYFLFCSKGIHRLFIPPMKGILHKVYIMYACGWSSSLVISHWGQILVLKKGICINLHFCLDIALQDLQLLHFFFKFFILLNLFFLLHSVDSQNHPPPPHPHHNQPFSFIAPPPPNYHSCQIQLHWTFLAQIINDCIFHTVHWPLTLQFDLSSHCFLDIYMCIYLYILQNKFHYYSIFLHDRSYSEKWHI